VGIDKTVKSLLAFPVWLLESSFQQRQDESFIVLGIGVNLAVALTVNSVCPPRDLTPHDMNWKPCDFEGKLNFP
jgi:hypothetical protein